MAEYEDIRRRIFDPRECPHKEVELRNKIGAGGVAHYWMQCLRCGQKASSRIPKKDVSDSSQIPLFDKGLEQAVWRKYNEDFAREKEVMEKAERSKLRDEYNHYLRTTQWKIKRDLVIKRDKGLCQGCFKNPATEVHHLTYEHIYEEFLFELVSVCSECHDRLHENKN